MLKTYTPPYITILFLICLLNIIFNAYFITIFLTGIVFKIFTISIRKEYNYILIFSIITFLIIENTQGMKLFSLTIISLLVYYLIMPRIKHVFSSALMADFLHLFAFYILFYILVQAYVVFDFSLLAIFIVNFFIDILIVGFML